MNRFRVAFRPEALTQLHELYDYIAEASSAATAADSTESIVIIGVFYGGRDFETLLDDASQLE